MNNSQHDFIGVPVCKKKKKMHQGIFNLLQFEIIVLSPAVCMCVCVCVVIAVVVVFTPCAVLTQGTGSPVPPPLVLTITSALLSCHFCIKMICNSKSEYYYFPV